MTLEVINPGGWDPEEVLTSDQMNLLQVEMAKAIDGFGGGVYELGADLVMNGTGEMLLNVVVRISSDLVIGPGAFLTVEGTLLVSGEQNVTGSLNVANELNIELGGELNVLDGGRIDVEDGAGLHLDAGSECDIDTDVDLAAAATLILHGTIQALSTSEINLETGSEFNAADGSVITLDGTVNMLFNSELNLASGADIIGADGAQIQVYEPQDLLINFASSTFRLSLTPVSAPGWDVDPGTGCLVMGAAVGDPDGLALFGFPLRVGDAVTTIRMHIEGGFGPGHPGAIASFDAPLLQLIRVSNTGVVTVLAEVADPTGVLPSGSFGAYDSPHTVTLSGATQAPGGVMPYTNASNTDVHYIRVLAEGGASGVPGTTRVSSIDGTGTARSFRQPFESL